MSVLFKIIVLRCRQKCDNAYNKTLLMTPDYSPLPCPEPFHSQEELLYLLLWLTIQTVTTACRGMKLRTAAYHHFS